MDSAALATGDGLGSTGFDSRLRTMSTAADIPMNNSDDVLSAALGYASAGWRVVPIGPRRKFPAMNAWQEHASTNPAEIQSWFTGMYKGHGVGVATGRESGVFVLDVDVSEGKHGDETLADLEARYGTLPPTVEVQTGSGGRHLYFRYPEGREVRNNAATKLGPGLDIRGDGGQVLAPPTVHPNGTPYTWVIGQEWDEHRLAYPPSWLVELLCEPPAPRAPAHLPSSLPRRNDRPGDRWADSITWKDLLERDGWTFHHTDANGEEFWTRPGKDRREGASATLYYKGADVLKVFTSSAPGLEPEGTYSRFAYLAATRFGGDYYAAAQWCATEVDGHRDTSPLTVTEPVTELEPQQYESVAMRGGDALASVEEAPPARWGSGDDVLWACGESLLIAGRTGVGKTTLATGVLAGLVGLEADCLGLEIRPATRVLYLGMDRPRQILRALARRFSPETFKVLNERMIFRKGPLPKDLAKEPTLLLTLAQQYGCDVVIVDSLKDAAVKIADEEVGGQINRAIQLCNTHDVDVLLLHHQRKGAVADRKNEDDTPTVEDVFGSNWITAGAGSVIILQGQPGDNVVKMHHVKQPADPVGPWMLEHDHHAGRTTRQEGGWDLLAYLKSKHPLGVSAMDAARAEHQNDKLKSTGKEAKSAGRRLDALVRRGMARRVDGGRGQHGLVVATKWHWEPRPNVGDGGEIIRDGVRDRGSRKESVTASVTPVTDSEFSQVTAVTPSVTALDNPPSVTGGGGIYTPTRHGGGPQTALPVHPDVDREDW